METLITEKEIIAIAELGRQAIYDVASRLHLVNSNTQDSIFNRMAEFKYNIAKAAENIISDMAIPSQYSHEVVPSSSTYPKEFYRKTENEQIAILCDQILDIDPQPVIEHLKKFFISPVIYSLDTHPQDGNYAILSPFAWQLMTSDNYQTDMFSSQIYCKMLTSLFELISNHRAFHNYRNNKINEQHLRQTERTAEFYKLLFLKQGACPIWIVNAQLGFLHKGKSIRRSRETFMRNEFGLGSIAAASIAITHPERFSDEYALNIDCAGDEFSAKGDNEFLRSTLFKFDEEKLRFDSCDYARSSSYFGSLSAFFNFE